MGYADRTARVARAEGRAEHVSPRRVSCRPTPQPPLSAARSMAKKIILNPVPVPPRPTSEILADIREIYFRTHKSTILRDFDRAIDLLKMFPTPEERQRATVFMDGLAEMRREFG